MSDLTGDIAKALYDGATWFGPEGERPEWEDVHPDERREWIVCASRAAAAVEPHTRKIEAERDEARAQVKAAREVLVEAEADRDCRKRESEELSIALTFALTGEEVQTDERYSNAVALAQAVIRADRAEAQVQAVRGVLAHHPYGGPDQEDAIRRALDGEVGA